MASKRNLFFCLLLSFFLAACGGGGSSSNDSGNGGNGDNGGNDGGGTVTKKLLSRFVANGQERERFRYDHLNRLVEMDSPGLGLRRFEYEGDDARPSLLLEPYPNLGYMYSRYQYGTDDLNGVPTNYFQTQSLNANQVPFSMIWRYYLNAHDRIIAMGTAVNDVFSPRANTYAYDDRGNLLKLTTAVGATWEYTYDDKKSPASETATPRWLFDDMSVGFLANPNNPLSEVYAFYPSRTYRTYRYTYDSDGYPDEVSVTSEVFNEATGVTINLGTEVLSFEYIPAH
ncbi:MAG: RHS repeat protein [Burkholderiales bacterium]|jgi:YD repeat-containing protein|nr:RHS repeat protein [Burkholderiales bacterium]